MINLIDGVYDADLKIPGAFHVSYPVLTKTDVIGKAIAGIVIHIRKTGAYQRKTYQ